MVLLAIIMNVLAALTGIIAVGGGRHWRFTVVDYFRGKRNALLYLWVTGSTIFSLTLSGALISYALRFHWQLRDADAYRWMVIHAVMGVLLILAHLFVATTLSKDSTKFDKYLWGKYQRAV